MFKSWGPYVGPEKKVIMKIHFLNSNSKDLGYGKEKSLVFICAALKPNGRT